MWDSVVIGEGEKLASSIHIFSIKGEHSISVNNTAYWIGNIFFGLGMTIYKSSQEGEHLTNMISTGSSLEEIEEYLLRVFLSNVRIDLFKKAIFNEKQNSFAAGRADMAKDVRALLGV